MSVLKQKMKNNGNLWLCVFILSLIPVPFFFYNFIKGNETKSWTPTDAVVTNSYIDYDYDDDYASDYHKNVREYSYAVVVSYEYTVESLNYSSNNYYYTWSRPYFSDYQNTLNRLAEFPVEKKITVYYNPENPTEVCMIQGNPGWIWILVIINVLIICFTGIISFKFLKKAYSSKLKLNAENKDTNNEYVEVEFDEEKFS